MKRNTEHVLEFCYIAMDWSGFDEIPWSVLQKCLKAHSQVWHYLATESSLKMMKNAYISR